MAFVRFEQAAMSFDPASFRQHVRTLLDRHAEAFGVSKAKHDLLRRQIARGDNIHSRRTFPGHVTTSAIVLDGAGRRTLLIRHRSLARWLQPGGHYEPPESLEPRTQKRAPLLGAIRCPLPESGHRRARTEGPRQRIAGSTVPHDALSASALREAGEETGNRTLRLDPWHRETALPIDIDSHCIPARPDRHEPEHWHHDIRYIVRAEECDGLRPDLSEVDRAEWRDVSELEAIMPEALGNMRKLGLVG